MDYHEAKYRTLWNLAFCIIGKQNFKLPEDFCEITKKIYPLIIKGITIPACPRCIIYKQCYQFSYTNDYQYLFDQLLDLKMPDIPMKGATQ